MKKIIQHILLYVSYFIVTYEIVSLAKQTYNFMFNDHIVYTLPIELNIILSDLIVLLISVEVLFTIVAIKILKDLNKH